MMDDSASAPLPVMALSREHALRDNSSRQHPPTWLLPSSGGTVAHRVRLPSRVFGGSASACDASRAHLLLVEAVFAVAASLPVAVWYTPGHFCLLRPVGTASSASGNWPISGRQSVYATSASGCWGGSVSVRRRWADWADVSDSSSSGQDVDVCGTPSASDDFVDVCMYKYMCKYM